MYKQLPIIGPWGGVVDSIGRPYGPLNSFDSQVNWFSRKGRLQTRPKLTAFGSATDGLPILHIHSIKDILGNLHTYAITTKHVYAVTAGPTFTALSFPGGVTDLGSINRRFTDLHTYNRIYFSNGVVPLLYADGSSSLKVAGDTPGGCRFLGILAQHVIQCYTTEDSIDFPNRVRWSKSSDPNSWSGFSAGFNDMIEIPDEITGYAAIGKTGYIFREEGVSVMIPTGIGTSPFAFEDLSNAPEGEGNAYPYSLAPFGRTHCPFVSNDEIWDLASGDMVPIGGAAKKKIFADLAEASGEVWGAMVQNLGTSFDFLSYWLTIPKSPVTDSATWVFNFDERSWFQFKGTSTLTAIATVYTS